MLSLLSSRIYSTSLKACAFFLYGTPGIPVEDGGGGAARDGGVELGGFVVLALMLGLLDGTEAPEAVVFTSGVPSFVTFHITPVLAYGQTIA
ncbi:MAG TPA: hypothetical protein VE223_00825, partial [Nitrososphaeraceae archaeon]|nr:hypothetical protein [Nitrososphaeraceae archaeon]